MLNRLWERPLIEKTRYRIPQDAVVWEIDEFEEMRLLQAQSWQGSLVPLHYAVESVYPGLFEEGMVPKLSNEHLEPFREILENLNIRTSRLRGLFKGPRGKRIINNCRMLLRTETAPSTRPQWHGRCGECVPGRNSD